MLKIIAYTLVEAEPGQEKPSTGNWTAYLSARLTRVTTGKLRVNPHLDQVQKEIMDWSVEMGLLEINTPQYIAYNQARFSELCALSLPDVTHETLLANSKLVQWLFTRDDGLDSTKGTMGTQTGLIRDHDAKLIKIISLKSWKRSAKTATEKALRKLTKMITAKKPSKESKALLVTRYHEYFQGNAVEADYRAKKEAIPIDAYKHTLRPFTSAVQVYEVFTNIIEKTKLTDDELKDVMYRELSNKAAAIVGIDNDIVSVEKERGDDFPENLILLEMAHDPSLSFEKAFDKTIEYRNQLVTEFLSIKKYLLHRNEKYEPIIKRLEMLIDGNVEWSCKTSRYARFPQELLETK